LYSDRQAEEVERLAYHAERGEVWEKALAYGSQAGRKAAQRSAHRQAAASFDQALSALQHLPETTETQAQAIDIRLELRSSLYPLGEFDRIIGRLREAQAVAETLGDQARLARVSAYLSSVLFTTGHYEAAINSAERTSALGKADGDLGAQILGNHYRGLAYHSLGHYDRAIELLTWNVETLRGALVFERFGLHGVAAVFSLSPLLWSLAERGDFDVALRRGDDQLRIAEASDHPYTRVAASIGVGLMLLRLGDLGRAIAVTERGVGLCRTWDNRALFPVVAAELGHAYTLADRVQEAISTLSEAVEAGDSIKATMNHALAVGWLGEALLLAGRTAEAAIQATRSLELARRRNERGAEAWALRLQADLAARQTPERAEGVYRQALALAASLGMLPLQAHCALGLGRLLRRAGRAEEGDAAVRIATDQYRALGMTHWQAQASADYF
jgi:tetratricopeptide (TPR) repeat protein